MGIGLQELETIEATKREPDEIIKDYLTFNSLGKVVSDTPQSLSKFYAGLKEANPKRRNRGIKSNSEAHFNAINLFLCLAFICVSKEADSDRDSANDSEDTSGYDSTASETLHGRLPCLSPDSVVLPSQDQIRKAADIWSACRGIYLSSPMFQKQFFKLGGLDVCNRLMMILIQNLLPRHIDFTVKKQETNAENKCLNEHTIPNQNILLVSGISDTASNLSVKGEATLPFTVIHNEDHSLWAEQNLGVKDPSDKTDEWSFQSIRLFEALLVIYLHSASSCTQKTEPDIFSKNLSVDEIMSEIRDQLYKSAVVSSELAIPLFDSLLRVALSETSTDSEKCELKAERKHQLDGESSCQPSELSEDAEESSCHSIKLFKEEEGYEADSESNPDDKVAKDDAARQDTAQILKNGDDNKLESTGNGELLYPEICMLELQLLSTCSPHLEVLTHTFQSLLSAIKRSHRNTMLMYQQQAGVRGEEAGEREWSPRREACDRRLRRLWVAHAVQPGSRSNQLIPVDSPLKPRISVGVREWRPGGTQWKAKPRQAMSSTEECQAVLVDLLVSLVTFQISSDELVLLLRLFLEKNPPTEILLNGFLQIVEDNMHMAPQQYLAFPLFINASVANSILSAPKQTSVLSAKTAAILKRGKMTTSKKDFDGDILSHHLSSSWHVAPIHLPLVGQNCWPHMADGFSVSLWIKTEWRLEGSAEKRKKPKRNKLVAFWDSSLDSAEVDKSIPIDCQSMAANGDKLVEDGCLHLISLGSKALMLQVWGDLNTGALIFRICIDPNDEMKAGVLAQAESQESVLTHEKWQHIAFTYHQQPESKKNVHGKLTIWVSGERKSDVALDYAIPRKTSLSSDSNKTFCMLGHCTSAQEDLTRLAGRWQIGNLLLFNGSVIGVEEAFHLYTSGPELSSIMPCKYGKSKLNYSKYITLERLQCEKLKELMMKNSEVDTGPLVESLAIVYASSSPYHYTIYEPVIRLKGQIKTMPSQRPFSAKEIQSTILDSIAMKSLQIVENQGLQSILHKIGGTSSFIFLFARTLLDGCCSSEILNMNEEGCLILNPESNAVIQDVKLFSEVLLDWKVWAKAQEKVQSMIYLRHSSSGGRTSGSPGPPVTPSGFTEAPSEGSLFPFAVEQQPSPFLETETQPFSDSYRSSPQIPTVYVERSLEELTDIAENESESESSSTRQEMGNNGSTETLKRICDDSLVSSCESAKTVCSFEELSQLGNTDKSELYPSTVEAPDIQGSTGVAFGNEEVCFADQDSEDKADSVVDENIKRPDSLKGIQSFQRSQSNFASLGLAFPAQNGNLAICRWPSMADRNMLPEDWENYTISPAYERSYSASDPNNDSSVTEDCLILVSCGLYDLVRGVLLILPDLLLEEVMDKLIQPEALIVLVNHPSPQVQLGVLKLLDAYFVRAVKEQKEKFLKNHGFSLLANQLYLHQGNPSLLECFLGMLFGRPVGLDEELDLEDMEKIDPFRKRCIIPVLGLIENSLYENMLVHNILCVLLQFLNACSKVSDILLDNGLLYVLFNTLAALNGMENGIPLNDFKLLVCDIQQLLVAITIHSCSSSGSQYFRIIEDLITLLGYLQTSENKRTQEMAMALQFRVLQSAIEFIKTTANQDSQKLSSSVHLPASHHHAIYQKRKSIAGPRRFSLAQSDTLLLRLRSVANDELAVMMERRMSQENPIRASESEYIQRLQRLTVLSVNRLIYQDGSCDFFDLLNIPQPPIQQRSSEQQSDQLDEGGSVKQTNSLKTFQNEILKLMMEGIKIGLHGPKLALYLYEMLRNHREQLSKEDQTAVSIFMTSLKLCGHKCIPPSAPTKPDLVKAILEEQKKFESEGKMNKAAWEKKIRNSQQSLIQRLDSKSKDISKIAADITQNVSLRQGMERKKVIQHIRGMYKIDLSASRYWQELVQQLTHDRAVWYNPSSYPTSWQLDPTEGPNRERRRLQRCYLTIPNKYLLKDRQKPEEPFKPPLSYLFEDKTHSYFSSTVKDKATSEHIRPEGGVRPGYIGGLGYRAWKPSPVGTRDHRQVAPRCRNIRPGRDAQEDRRRACASSRPQGGVRPGKSGMYFVEDNATDTYDNPARDDVYHNILTSNLPNLLEYGNITALTHLWCSGQITNFEYLTHLNKHAGRSFNDLMQYPVFPFILRDYTNETLDLSEPSIYRNLSKPIAVQSKEKEDRYVDNYKYLEEEYRKGIREDDPMPPVQPYHYGSHYSNSGTVLHFLVRMPPFTKMFLAYQDQSFDIPDRTFHSMNTTWRLSSYESMTDVKELIPEFFYLPEFLVNREGFDFGVRQNGERVNHVNLPPWARNDPRLFILIHRQALESDQVSQTLCQWIDLVFGYKQKGKAAVNAINVFHPATYFGMDVSAVEDPVQRRALETMIKTYGQTPRQLFNAAHLSRAGSRLTIDGELPAAMGILVQFAFRETKDHVKDVVYPVIGRMTLDLILYPNCAIFLLYAWCSCVVLICVRSMHSTDIQWSAILSWGYADNILRLKSKQSEPPVNFIQCSQLFQVTSCAWVPDSCQLFTGSECGVITAYNSRFTSSTLHVCYRLCYVQSLTGHKSPVSAVSASETTGDIATVCDSVGGGSDLRLWTVNGDLIGHVHCREIICSVAFSNQPEGVSVNVIAGGLENGVVSLTYSCDGHHLYTANSEGTVIAWCRRDQQRMKLPMFYSFLSSYAAG
ncbi:LYST regulator, partial [Polypterus senegalus]